MKYAILFKNMLGQRKPCSFRNIEKKLKIKSLPLKHNLSKDLFSLYNYNNDEQIRLNIGGDHSISIATLSSSIKKHGNNKMNICLTVFALGNSLQCNFYVEVTLTDLNVPVSSKTFHLPPWGAFCDEKLLSY